MRMMFSTMLIMALLLNAYPIVRASGGDEFNPSIYQNQTLIDRPVAIEIDDDGNMYIANYGNHQIVKLDSHGNLLTQWGGLGSGNGQFNYPSGVAIDSNANVYVVDRENHRIQKFDADGTYLTEWGRRGANDGEFRNPANIEIDRNTDIAYVTDRDNHRVQKFDLNGQFLGKWGGYGNGDGEFNRPYGVAIDDSGIVYITESENHRVQKFDADGTYISQWGSQGVGNGQFMYPFDIAIDNSGYVYVPDAQNNRVQKFDLNGNYISQWGSAGNGSGQFPNSIAIDRDGNVYVTEANNPRIQKFDPDGDYLGGWPRSAPSITPQIESFDRNEAGIHYRDITVTLEANDHVLSGILNGSTTLIEGSDYLRVGNMVTITKEYLATLSIGQSVLTFDFSTGPQLPLTIDISNSTPIPGAPHLQPAIAGDEQVSLTWSPVDDATSYNIYQSISPSVSGTEVGTVVGSVYDYTATGLVNGTTYYFTVKGENVQGESPASNIVSATPFTLPDAPTNVLAVAGNRQATINFDAPAFDGGSTITSYEVTADPGGLTATGTASPITFSGLTNGTTYTFTVKAINAGGKGAESMPSNPITPRVPSSDGGGVTPTPSPIPEPTPTPSKPKPPLTGIEVQIAGKVANQGTMSVVESSEEDRTTMVIYLDQSKLEEQLEATEAGSVVSVSVSKDTDDVYVELSGTQLEYLVRKQSVIELQIAQGIYRLPIQAIDVASIIAGLGEPVIQNDLTFRIGMGLPSEGTLKLARDAESMESFNLLGTPLDFTFQAIYGDDQREVVWFNQYVERLIKLPEGTSPNQVATAVVLNHDGTVRHVPTRIVMINGQSYAVVNSITNSTYALISHSLNFKDVHAQWAKTAANDLGARLIVHGDSHGRFHPEQEVTRAEFAAILVRGLGLGPNHNDKGFSYSDVNPTAWYSDAIQTAQAYHLIAGFEDGSFRPQDKLTREQAMSILAAAMKWTGLHDQLPAQPAAELLRPFADAGEAGLWARRAIADNLQAGIVTGRNEKTLAPKAFITRAEATVIVQRLLKESGFID